MDLSKVTHCKIHPAIGVARVGNSLEPHGFFGPEVPGVPPNPRDGFKDREGRIKRQVARFRIYGYDQQGQALGEVTADDADITWTVHLANTKADWFEFHGAMDHPNALPSVVRRNQNTTDDRSLLRIDPGPRSLSGSGQAALLDGGSFLGQRVTLG